MKVVSPHNEEAERRHFYQLLKSKSRLWSSASALHGYDKYAYICLIPYTSLIHTHLLKPIQRKALFFCSVSARLTLLLYMTNFSSRFQSML